MHHLVHPGANSCQTLRSSFGLLPRISVVHTCARLYLAHIASEHGIKGYPWNAFVSAIQDTSDALAEASGRTYCNDCGGWYLPHAH